MRKRLFLIDGTALIYRAHFALIRNPLYTSTGMNTSAMFGTFNMFLSFLDRYHPDHLLISFDRKEKTFRHELDPNYKMNRPPAPPEMIEQIQSIKDFFELAGVKELSIAGYEADDILASLADKFKADYDIIIVTGDKDFAQIVEPGVVLYDPKSETVTDKAKVLEKYGITAEQFVDYLALCGDSADNIPGVKGIGPKSASKLLQEFWNLDNIYSSLKQISSDNIRKKLEESRDDAYLSRQLAQIVRDLPLEVSVEDLKFDAGNLGRTLDLLNKYELRSLVKRITPPEQDIFSILEMDIPEPEKEFQAVLIETNAAFENLLKEIAKAEVIALDTETTSIDPIRAELVGISLCFSEEKAYYLPLKHQMADNLEAAAVKDKLTAVLKDKFIIGHHFKYDFLVLKQAGWHFQPEVFDTMLADYLLHPTERHSLETCALRYFNYEMTLISALIGKGNKQIGFDLVSTRMAADYSAEDAWITWKLYHTLQPELEKHGLAELFKKVEIPLLYTLANMELNGVLLDEKFLRQLSHQVQARIGELTNSIFELAGEPFNLNSTQQAGNILFNKMNIPPQRKTKTGYSVDQDVLESLAAEHEIARLLLEYRMLNKLDSTYISALPLLINPATNRIHSSFNQTVASTGRLSSSNPNLQNIPIRSELGREVRKAFITPDTDWLMVSADYSQIELRIFAILTHDQTLISTFKANRDIHSKTASLIYGIPQEEVTSDQRRFAKVINFGLLYGMGAYRISSELSISRQEAQKFIDNYFQNFPTVDAFIKNHLETAAQKGYVETILGRKLYLPDLNSRNGQNRKAAERIAVNMPVQGSAADLIKIAMNQLYDKIKDDSRIKMLIQVHDELVFEVHKDFLEEAKALIHEIMENALPDEYRNIVPLKVDIGVGKNWFEAH
ncbi:MAG: DNA polymerase I [Candidatus Cloacimonetes bacterium]|nr:DNA polymerase I [Candidatus Cloacimonadota bacterium]